MAIKKVVLYTPKQLAFISIPFTKTDGTYTLTDSLVLPSNHTFADVEIEQIEQDRFDKYVIFMTTPVVVEEVV